MKVAPVIGSLFLIGVLVAGCEFFNSDRTLGENIVILNETPGTIEVLTVRDGTESSLATLEPGQGRRISAALFSDGCLTGPFVARRDDGTVVATREGEFCSGDTWEVVAEAAPGAS